MEQNQQLLEQIQQKFLLKQTYGAKPNRGFRRLSGGKAALSATIRDAWLNNYKF